MLREPLSGGKGPRGLSFTFRLTGSGDAQNGHAESAMKAMLHEDRVLKVGRALASRFEKPNTFRRLMRGMIRQARELKPGEPCPCPAMYQVLLVKENTPAEEIALQLVVVLSRWGLFEPNECDLKRFVAYASGLFKNRDRFVIAAGEAASLVFTNWVLSQDWQDFRRYCKQTTWALYRKGAHASRKSPSYASPTGDIIDWADSERERNRRGKLRQRGRSTHFCVAELAQAAHVDFRRIYEAISAKVLPATKIGQSLRIENQAAERFILEAEEKRQILALREQLLNSGMSREALRKQIYRLRKTGASSTKVIERLQKMSAHSNRGKREHRFKRKRQRFVAKQSINRE